METLKVIEKVIDIYDDQIITHAIVSRPDKSMAVSVRALWDTGATNTVISESIVHKLSLVETAQIPMQSVLKSHTVKMYAGIVCLEELCMSKQYHYSLVSYPYSKEHTYDMIIGMDIIKLGNFSLTLVNEGTQQLFRFFL